jgi:2-furoyl-CoA dehydrogenase large subunit
MTTNRAGNPYDFRYIGTRRRTKEDPRFVTGRGHYAADVVLAGLVHVALVASPHASAKIKSIRSAAARAMPGVHYVLTGEEFCAETDALMPGIDAPKVTRWALTQERVRYAGEWVPPWSRTRARSLKMPPNWSRSITSRWRM